MTGRTASRPPSEEDLAAEVQVLEYRRDGLTFEAIKDLMPRFSQRGSVHRAYGRALARVVKEPAEEARELDRIRLDALLAAVWPKAMDGDLDAVASALRVLARRAKLLGLDLPTRAEQDRVDLLALLGGKVQQLIDGILAAVGVDPESPEVARVVAQRLALTDGRPDGVESEVQDAELEGDVG